MPDSQVVQLRRMMQREHRQSYLEVCLSPACLKKKEIVDLEAGDLLLLDLKQLELDILEEGVSVAKASYGIRNGEPYICIASLEKRPVPSYNSKKYEVIKVSLGMIEKNSMEEGKMIALSQIREHDAILYREDQRIAKARFVTVGQKIALQITDILR